MKLEFSLLYSGWSFPCFSQIGVFATLVKLEFSLFKLKVNIFYVEREKKFQKVEVVNIKQITRVSS